MFANSSPGQEKTSPHPLPGIPGGGEGGRTAPRCPRPLPSPPPPFYKRISVVFLFLSCFIFLFFLYFARREGWRGGGGSWAPTYTFKAVEKWGEGMGPWGISRGRGKGRKGVGKGKQKWPQKWVPKISGQEPPPSPPLHRWLLQTLPNVLVNCKESHPARTTHLCCGTCAVCPPPLPQIPTSLLWEEAGTWWGVLRGHTEPRTAEGLQHPY